MTLTKKQIYLISILFLLLFATLCCNTIFFITIISLVQIAIAIIFFKTSKQGLFALSLIFLLMAYITHLGHFYIYTFELNADVPLYFDTFRNIPIFEILISGKYITMFLNTLTIGFIIGESKKNKTRVDKNKTYNLNAIKKIGYCFVIIGFIFEVIKDYQLIRGYLSGNYLTTTTIIQSGVMNTLANFFLYGLLCLMISYQEKKTILRIYYLIFNFTLIIPMLSGNRLNAVMFMVVGAFLYFKLIRKTTLITYVKLFLLGYFLILFVNIIADFRVSGLSYIEILKQLPEYVLSHSPLYDALGEFGVTDYSVIYCLRCIPVMKDFGYGLSYICSIFTVLPDIFGINQIIEPFVLFTTNFPSNYASGLGGSFIGEIYYNFSYFGIPIGILLGMIVIYYENKLVYAFATKKWITVIMLLPLCVMLLIWTRGYFRDFIRVFVWNTLLIYLILNFTKKRRRF